MITAILAGFIAGIGLSLLPQANLFFGEIPLIFAGILAVLVLISRLKFAIFLMIFAGMILGINRGLPAQGDLSSWQNVIGKNANITAKVEQDPGRRIGRDELIFDGYCFGWSRDAGHDVCQFIYKRSEDFAK